MPSLLQFVKTVLEIQSFLLHFQVGSISEYNALVHICDKRTEALNAAPA